MADVIGIRDDMYIGKGDAYLAEVSESVQQAYEDGVLDHRPTLISLQSDSDHPTQSSADMLYLINEFGGLENLKGCLLYTSRSTQQLVLPLTPMAQLGSLDGISA